MKHSNNGNAKTDAPDRAETHDFPAPICGVPSVVNVTYACGQCQAPIFRLSKKTWHPVCSGMSVNSLRFRDIDPKKRLDSAANGNGIALPRQLVLHEWDYEAKALLLFFHPVYLHPATDTESIALAISLFKDRGWYFSDEEGRDWEQRWEKHYSAKAGQGHAPEPQGCPVHGPQGMGQVVVVPAGAMPVVEREEDAEEEFDEGDARDIERADEEFADAMDREFDEAVDTEVERRLRKLLDRGGKKKKGKKDASGKKKKKRKRD